MDVHIGVVPVHVHAGVGPGKRVVDAEPAVVAAHQHIAAIGLRHYRDYASAAGGRVYGFDYVGVGGAIVDAAEVGAHPEAAGTVLHQGIDELVVKLAVILSTPVHPGIFAAGGVEGKQAEVGAYQHFARIEFQYGAGRNLLVARLEGEGDGAHIAAIHLPKIAVGIAYPEISIGILADAGTRDHLPPGEPVRQGIGGKIVSGCIVFIYAVVQADQPDLLVVGYQYIYYGSTGALSLVAGPFPVRDAVAEEALTDGTHPDIAVIVRDYAVHRTVVGGAVEAVYMKAGGGTAPVVLAINAFEGAYPESLGVLAFTDVENRLSPFFAGGRDAGSEFVAVAPAETVGSAGPDYAIGILQQGADRIGRQPPVRGIITELGL